MSHLRIYFIWGFQLLVICRGFIAFAFAFAFVVFIAFGLLLCTSGIHLVKWNVPGQWFALNCVDYFSFLTREERKKILGFFFSLNKNCLTLEMLLQFVWRFRGCLGEGEYKNLTLPDLNVCFQVKVWFQNRRMKWRHSKEAQAQKDKEKDEKGEKSLSESGGREPKEPLESECESEGGSDCESDEAGEESADGHLDISEHNKPSVIMSGSAPASSTETVATVTDTAASQVLIWGRI